MSPHAQPGTMRNHEVAVDTRLSTSWARAAQTAWLVYAVLTGVMVIVGVPLAFAQLRVICEGATCGPFQLSAAQARAFHDLGISFRSIPSFDWRRCLS